MCDEIIESFEEETNLIEKKYPVKRKISILYLHFLLITIALLIALSIYCYLIKFQAKQKHLLPFHDTINELK